MIYASFLKRPVDFLLSFIALIILLPVIVTIALLIRIKLGKPVIYRVDRPGKDEKLFVLYKFRSMSNATDEHGNLLPDHMRLNKLGFLIRKFSLDELPELFNILKGDMSFVGPRPLAKQYLPYYSEFERMRHSIRPGLTGLAQVNGRNSLSWEEKFQKDIEYVEKISFLNDIQIILKTIFMAAKAEDIGIRGINAPEDFDKYRNKQLYGNA